MVINRYMVNGTSKAKWGVRFLKVCFDLTVVHKVNVSLKNRAILRASTQNIQYPGILFLIFRHMEKKNISSVVKTKSHGGGLGVSEKPCSLSCIYEDAQASK